MSTSGQQRGALAIVLHTHMPYVEGFGTWPFGEEWLWEAIAGCYLPLLDLLDSGAPLSLSLTPVLCDQLEAPGIAERFRAFVGEVRRYTHEEDAKGLRDGGHEDLAREVERSWGDYERALERFDRCDGDLLGALAPYAQWTSSATHAVLPLLATDAGVRAQVQTGGASHRARFAGEAWRGGFWLPECAYAPWLAPALADAGVHATCVELTNRLGLGAREHLRPLVDEQGVTFVPIDRATIALVWSDDGYPANGVYRDYHHHTVHHHNPWGNDGEPYDHEAALALAREHAADFVARTRERLRRDGAGLPGGGLAVCALDTELLGHWWYEGIAWLQAVVEECARQGLELVRLDDALERIEPASLDGAKARERRLPPGVDLPIGDALSMEGGEASSWGNDGDLSTWSGPQVAELAFATRACELEVVAAGSAAGPAAVRELLALQGSDWPFMLSRGLAVPYARERFEGHRMALARALAEGPGASEAGLRNIAVYADAGALQAP
ncbi:MAG: 1,4-alpha-glucan branching protein domain-containing protein [Solirubrobacteraceae bacterium]